MPNDADTDRLLARLANQVVVSLDDYKRLASQRTNTSTPDAGASGKVGANVNYALVFLGIFALVVFLALFARR